MRLSLKGSSSASLLFPGAFHALPPQSQILPIFTFTPFFFVCLFQETAQLLPRLPLPSREARFPPAELSVLILSIAVPFETVQKIISTSGFS